MRQLPNELACAVFELLSLADRISATHVCKRWRRIALGSGRLWSSILCRNPVTLEGLLERTVGVPVDVQVTGISQSNFEAILSIMAAHLDHIRLLSLQSGDEKLSLDRAPALHRAFARPALLLEAVDIQLFDVYFPRNSQAAIHEASVARGACIVPADSFLHRAPRLRQLAFRTMPLPDYATEAFSGVRTLELDVVHLSAPDMLALVSLPRLRSLHLDAVTCELPQVPAPPTFKLDALWFDGLYAMRWADPLHPMLRYLGFPHIRHFTSTWQDMLPMTSAPPRSLPQTLIVEHWDVVYENLNTEAWRMVDGAGFVADLLDVHTCDLFSWPGEQRMLAHLTELVIVYYELRMAVDYDIEFRNLSRLCVRLTTRDCAQPDSYWPETAGLPAPRLRTVELWGGIEQSTVTMRALSVASFVRDFLTLDRAHPPELILRDVDISHSAEELAQLEDLVAGIRQPEGPAPESFVVELKSKWHASVRP